MKDIITKQNMIDYKIIKIKTFFLPFNVVIISKMHMILLL